VTLGQHRFTPSGVDPSSSLTVLAALAATTTTLRLATNILILGLYHPVDIAEQAATIDEMSGRRLILGVGLGYHPYEFQQIGLDYTQRVSRLEEGVEVLRSCWAKAPASLASTS
jgi:alkanesulfonate monooxygenase SsuD/methylene tetrahydromethanopterin reductase-like flavin-dependent oxidoreductase (luciferase family)